MHRLAKLQKKWGRIKSGSFAIHVRSQVIIGNKFSCVNNIDVYKILKYSYKQEIQNFINDVTPCMYGCRGKHNSKKFLEKKDGRI